MALLNPVVAGRYSGLQAHRALLLLVVLSASGLALAHSPAIPRDVGKEHPTGHTQDHGDLSWPPQPRGITNVLARRNAGVERRAAKAREQLAAALERVALARADVREALGGRYARVGVIEQALKDGSRADPVIVYFSHETNSTVEVTLDGQRVRSLRRTPAGEYQPEITDVEVTEAEGIARAHFSSLGEERVAQLEAFGILAYQPTGSGFYDSRVIYISFHPNNDSFPEFAAWVDLTHRRVIRTLKE